MSRSGTVAVAETANERFKRGFANWFWGGLFLATVAHFVLFIASPTFNTQDVSYGTGELAAIELPDEIEIPPPPEAVARPAAPVIVAADVVDQDLTIAPTTFDANPVENLPPPPTGGDDRELSAAPVFTPMTVSPTLKNPGAVQQALLKYYPPLLRDAGIGGTVNVWFFIDENGRVQRTLVHQSSGFDAFDSAALQVADLMEFTPAYNRDQRVPVWVSIPVRFETQ